MDRDRPNPTSRAAELQARVIRDTHLQLRAAERYHRQGVIPKFLQGDEARPADYDPYMVATLYMPPIEGGPYVTITPAGTTSLFLTQKDVMNPIFEPDVSLEDLGISGDEPLVNSPDVESAGPGAEAADAEDEEEEDEEDVEVEGLDVDPDFRLIGGDMFDASTDGSGIVYPENNPFGFSRVGNRVETIPMNDFVRFPTVSRATLPTICGLNGNIRFAAWHKSVRQVLSHSKKLERYLFSPVAEMKLVPGSGTGALKGSTSILLPPGLYVLAGDSGVGKTTMITNCLPKLIGPAGRWLKDDLILQHNKLISYVGFGEPVMFARDGNDYAGLCLDLSLALTRCPIAVVDSLKMAQIVGSGPAKEGGFFRWIYMILQSWARLAQLNGVIIIVVMHYFGLDQDSKSFKSLQAELDAVTSGILSLDAYNESSSNYSMKAKVRLPLAVGSREMKNYLVPAQSGFLQQIARFWAAAVLGVAKEKGIL